MSAQVKWREDRAAWYLVVYDAGSRRVKRLGPTAADKRRGERRAKEWNRKRERGAIGLERPKPKPVPFDEFATRWLRTKVQLPIDRKLSRSVAPKTAKQREQMLRLHLLPHLGKKDVRSIDIARVDWLWEQFLESGAPRSQRSMEIALGVLRLILADAWSRESCLRTLWISGRQLNRGVSVSPGPEPSRTGVHSTRRSARTS